MAWDIAEPQDTTKIRDLGTVIRPNWVAIDQADSTFKPLAFNFANRTPDPAANNPTAIADAYILYCKDDGAGNPELFGIDENSVISQFTATGSTMAQDGYTVIAPAAYLQWGRSTTVAGFQTITFPIAFSATAWVVHATPYENYITGSTPNPFGVKNITATTADVGGLNAANVAGKAFGWIAIGPI